MSTGELILFAERFIKILSSIRGLYVFEHGQNAKKCRLILRKWYSLHGMLSNAHSIYLFVAFIEMAKLGILPNLLIIRFLNSCSMNLRMKFPYSLLIVWREDWRSLSWYFATRLSKIPNNRSDCAENMVREYNIDHIYCVHDFTTANPASMKDTDKAKLSAFWYAGPQKSC